MPDSNAISETFEKMRALPVEVSFAQVEHWVLNQSARPERKNKWLPFFLAKFLNPWSKN